jgi:hypothetical protein
MEKIGKGYTPRVTPLTHEQAFIASRTEDEQMTPPDNGGWNVETREFAPVRSYRRLNNHDYDDNKLLSIPLWRLFLDAYTAAVENGCIDRASWKTAFRFREDWLALGMDLLDVEKEWMNERHYHAIVMTALYREEAGAKLATYRDFGIFLTEVVKWQPNIPALRLV